MTIKRLVSASSIEKDFKKRQTEVKKKHRLLLGEILAKRAKEKKINKVFFDSGSNKNITEG